MTMVLPMGRRAVIFITIRAFFSLCLPFHSSPATEICQPAYCNDLQAALTEAHSPIVPKRFQVKRVKGWKMPTNGIYVGRPTKWGNPFKISRTVSRAKAVALYEDRLRKMPEKQRSALLEPLRSKSLGCWCPLNEPCHADVLLKWANV